MDSPFPGMDPYLEQHWRSVHQRLITYAGDLLQSALPQHFRVEVEERVFVVGDPAGERSIVPDAYVIRRPNLQRPGGGSPDGSVVAVPLMIELPDEPISETYLQIIDSASGNKVVTALEFLSPTNKIAGDGSDLYVRKQREYRVARVNQVEIDLTRSGDRSLVFPIRHIPREHRTLYLACVRRGERPSTIEAYPLPLRQPLATLGVPLDPAHADIPLDLQWLIAQCYRNGRYDDMDYSQELDPPLPAADAAWADQLLRDQGRR